MRRILLLAGFAACTAAQAFDPVDVYIVKFGHGGNAAGGSAVAEAQSIGTSAAGSSGGAVAGGIVAAGGMVANLLSPVDQEKTVYVTVVGITKAQNGECKAEEITLPFKNLQRDKSIIPMRWARLERNTVGEYALKPLADKAAVKQHPCYPGYLALVREKSPRFNPEEFYQ